MEQKEKSELRQYALSVAKEIGGHFGNSVEQVLKDADTIYAWLSKGL